MKKEKPANVTRQSSATRKEDNRQNEIIRIQKKRNNFVMLDKGFLEDGRLSFKAKGILAYLLSKPDGWKVIVKDIVNHGKEGARAVYNGLKELNRYGYYRKYPVREGQRIVRWESVVYECPEDFQEEQKENKTVKKYKKKEPKPMEKPQDSLLCGFVHVENEDVDFVHIQNSEHNNINIKNNQINQDNISIYQIDNKPEMLVKQTMTDNDMIDIEETAIKKYTPEEVADKISLDELKNKYGEKQEEINMLYNCICEVLTVDNPITPTFRISKQNIPFATVKNMFNQLEKAHLEYVVDCLNKNDNKYKINKNTKSYFMTSLFHAPRTISYYFNRFFQNPPLEKEKSTLEILIENKIRRDMEIRLSKIESDDEIQENYVEA